jgi:hypothetical protein
MFMRSSSAVIDFSFLADPKHTATLMKSQFNLRRRSLPKIFAIDMLYQCYLHNQYRICVIAGVAPLFFGDFWLSNRGRMSNEGSELDLIALLFPALAANPIALISASV